MTEELNMLLIEAIRNDELEKVKMLLKEGADPHYDDEAPLIDAVMYSRVDILKHLISLGANTNVADNLAAYMAISNEDPKILKILLDNGVSQNYIQKQCFNQAADKDNLDVIKLILEHGFNPFQYLNNTSGKTEVKNMVKGLISDSSRTNTKSPPKMDYLIHLSNLCITNQADLDYYHKELSANNTKLERELYPSVPRLIVGNIHVEPFNDEVLKYYDIT